MDSYQSPNEPIVSFSTQEIQRQNRRRIVRWGLMGVAVLAIVLTVVALVGSRHNNNETPLAISENVAHVSIENSGLLPTTVRVRRGQEITWTNNDAMPHHLTADQTTLPSFDSAEGLNQGDTYTYIFDKSGTYRYYDAVDPQKYVGTITVD